MPFQVIKRQRPEESYKSQLNTLAIHHPPNPLTEEKCDEAAHLFKSSYASSNIFCLVLSVAGHRGVEGRRGCCCGGGVSVVTDPGQCCLLSLLSCVSSQAVGRRRS
jgi:hypothetical protein